MSQVGSLWFFQKAKLLIMNMRVSPKDESLLSFLLVDTTDGNSRCLLSPKPKKESIIDLQPGFNHFCISHLKHYPERGIFILVTSVSAIMRKGKRRSLFVSGILIFSKEKEAKEKTNVKIKLEESHFKYRHLFQPYYCYFISNISHTKEPLLFELHNNASKKCYQIETYFLISVFRGEYISFFPTVDIWKKTV